MKLSVLWVLLWLDKYTLTGHFIRYTLLVLGWTPFCLQNCLNPSWYRFNKVLETFLREFGPYWHDSIMQLLQILWIRIRISHSTTSQSCSIGLISGDCGGHLSAVNSLSCPRNQSEMIHALWHGTLFWWLCVKIPVDQKFLKYSDQSFWHQQPCHVHLNHLSSPVLMLVWTAADCLDHVYMAKCIELLPCDWLIRNLC